MATCGRSLGEVVAVNVAAVDDNGRPLAQGADTSGASRRAQFNGVETCGNGNLCLRCAAKIRGRRAADFGRVIRKHLDQGGGAYLVTFTFSHERHEHVGDVVDDAMEAWKKLQKARAWERFKGHYLVSGFIRSTEVNHSVENGAHPHHHIVLLTDRPLSFDDLDGGEVEEFRQDLDRLWSHQVAKLDRQVHNEIGVTVVPIRDDNGIGAYVSKIELELARSDLKGGRRAGSRSMWQVAADAAQQGDPTDVAVWHQFFADTVAKRRRFMATSKGLYARYGITETER